jgi:dolichyl-phosphate-mannose--protein O-mannosyl transferase
MYTYHGKTVVNSTHPYSSDWWMWILNIRPLFYYSHTFAEVDALGQNLKGGISAFGNPAVWYLGIFAFIFTAYRAVRYGGKPESDTPAAVFLALAYTAQVLPWVFVSRTTYIYHYFPAVPFLVIMTGYMFKKTVDVKTWKKALPLAYAAAVLILFIMYYPVLTGTPVSVDFVRNVLRWLPSWQFIV